MVAKTPQDIKNKESKVIKMQKADVRITEANASATPVITTANVTEVTVLSIPANNPGKQVIGKHIGQKKSADIKVSNKTDQNQKTPKTTSSGDKSWVVTLLLAFFLGGLGLHRFYLGYTWQGVVQLLTLGGLGIWVLIDFVRIIMKDLKPKDGDYN